MKKLVAADLFCGAGGTSAGLIDACSDLGLTASLTAINHWDVAVATHTANHPEARHLCASLDALNPRQLYAPGELNVLWASPECFPAGTLILTSSGLLPIECVNPGAFVLTHKGRWRRVIDRFTKMERTVEVHGYGHYGLVTTANHPFYSKRITNRYPTERTPDGKKRRPGKRREMAENPYWPRADEMAGKLWATPTHFEPLPMPICPDVEFSDSLFYLIGRYLGDGSLNKGDVEISCGYAKVEKFSKLLMANPVCDARGTAIPFRTRELRTAEQFRFGNIALAEWLSENFGRDCYTKGIPAWVFGVQDSWKRALLSGYSDSDGYVGRRTEHTTVSKPLAIGIRLVAAALGKAPSLYRSEGRDGQIEGRSFSGVEQFRVAWTTDPKNETTLRDSHHLFTPVNEVVETGRVERVFTLEVDEDHSYVADGLTVKNCTHHSVARGGAPINDQSRATAWCVVRWAEALQPPVILVENVKEFETWGPVTKKGKPIRRRRGETFRAWIGTLRSLGYTVDWRVLNAADYGDPTSRRRLFIQAVRGRRSVVWPAATHSPLGGLAEDGRTLMPHVAARTIIDWEDMGESIWARKRPLKPNTMRRIMIGLERFGLAPFVLGMEHGGRVHNAESPLPTITTAKGGAFAAAKPYLIKLRGTNNASSIEAPAPTVTATGTHLALATPYLIQTNRGNGKDPKGNERRIRPVDAPFPTVNGNRGEWAVCRPYILPQQQGGAVAHSIEAPLSTVTTAGAHALAVPYLVKYYGSGAAAPVNKPLDTVTTKPRFGLCQPRVELEGETYTVDILFRMLRPGELAAAQGFRPGYQFTGNKTEIVKQIGNAVPRGLSRAIVRAVLSQKPH